MSTLVAGKESWIKLSTAQVLGPFQNGEVRHIIYPAPTPTPTLPYEDLGGWEGELNHSAVVCENQHLDTKSWHWY